MDYSVNLRRKDTTKGPPLRILSLDGGGVRGYSMLIILQELMYRIYVECEGKAPRREEIPKPCDHFDLIVGTGTGGLIALMLGRLRLDLETCKDVYVRMTRRVFETDKTIAGIPFRSTLFKASRLEEAIRECVREHTVFEAEGNDMSPTGHNSLGGAPFSPNSMSIPQRSGSRASFSTNASHSSGYGSQRNSTLVNGLRWGNPDALLYDNREYRTKTAVTTLYKGTTSRNGSSVFLRSYDSRKEPPPEFNCTIWQAGRATSATGMAFKPIQIGQHVFIDEGAGTYNPAPQVLDETINEWPGREVGAFVSVGTGKRPPGTNNRQHEWWEDFFGDALGTFAEARRRLIAKIEGCEDIHLAMLRDHLAKRNVSKDNYYRLNVEVGVGEFGMNEWNRLADISTNTRRYLTRPEVKRQILDAGVKFAKIERSHRRLAEHAAAGHEHAFDDSSSILQSPVLSVPPPSNPMAVELPAELPGDFVHYVTTEDDLPVHPTPQDTLLPSPARVSGDLSPAGSRPSSQAYGSPRPSMEHGHDGHPPPVPPKTPIPYPSEYPSELGGIPMPMPLSIGGHHGANGKMRPPYPVDEPPVVNKQRKPSYHYYVVRAYCVPQTMKASCGRQGIRIASPGGNRGWWPGPEFEVPASRFEVPGSRFQVLGSSFDSPAPASFFLSALSACLTPSLARPPTTTPESLSLFSPSPSSSSSSSPPSPSIPLASCLATWHIPDPTRLSMDMDMDTSLHSAAIHLLARASTDSSSRPASYKVIGICLAVASGLFIGVSFVLKKTGLLRANVKYNEEAGEGYGYLKNLYWWGGMTLMIIGELCNFVAYAFVDAILVTPLGALTVVVTTVLSAIFLKERLSFVGKVGCFCCILGSVVIALNAPEQSSVSDIQEMKKYVIAPGFLVYAGLIIVGCVVTAVWLGPRYGKKSMFVYISICSLIGGLSVVATQGLGSAILAQINGEAQFNQWFMYVLLVFVISTLLTEIIYLNKALNLFNAALVTPTYYVMFTTSTIVTSAILFQGFKGSVTAIITVIMGFLMICAGVVLLQLSKSAKDVPDAAVFKGDLDQLREVANQEESETEPKADSIRGAAAIIRRISTPRRTMEAEEARRYFRERNEDLKPPGENEIIEWDGLRRRKTVVGEGPTMAGTRLRSPSIKHPFPPLPPMGMSRVPEEGFEEPERPDTKQSNHSFLDDLRSRANSLFHPSWQPIEDEHANQDPVSLTSMSTHKQHPDTSYSHAILQDGSRSNTPWTDDAAPDPPPHGTRRQFSFNTMLHRMKTGHEPTPSRSYHRHTPQNSQTITEEERLGLVKGDSRGESGPDEADEKLDRMYSSDGLDDISTSLPSGHSPEQHRVYSSESMYPARLRVNPLPPLPDEEPLAGPYAPVEPPPAPRHESHSSHGSLSSPPRGVGWRRHGSTSSGGSLPGRRGAFI
ncbi:DUF803-domain-containing protein [Aspergillus ellipticus CBS 707.79]|uniref:DUF803-domain-containing protein n=1 Tax=Aspergillus ellipticus CBS 707.79 TaxID=1448320 RepID=A0A319E444_9EURO|nr:DUF803-domain-containing protein [Aspergillus ellipticus CBS 707.79]